MERKSGQELHVAYFGRLVVSDVDAMTCPGAMFETGVAQLAERRSPKPQVPDSSSGVRANGGRGAMEAHRNVAPIAESSILSGYPNLRA